MCDVLAVGEVAAECGGGFVPGGRYCGRSGACGEEEEDDWEEFFTTNKL